MAHRLSLAPEGARRVLHIGLAELSGGEDAHARAAPALRAPESSAPGGFFAEELGRLAACAGEVHRVGAGRLAAARSALERLDGLMGSIVAAEDMHAAELGMRR